MTIKDMRTEIVSFLETLQAEGRIAQWFVGSNDKARHEVYVTKCEATEERVVEEKSVEVLIAVDLDDQFQGEARTTIGWGTGNAREIIESLIGIAKQSQIRKWTFPAGSGSQTHARHCSDPEFAESLVEGTWSLVQGWKNAVESLPERTAPQSPGHFEVFAVRNSRHCQNSSGLEESYLITNVYVEGSLVTEEHERFFSRRALSPRYLSVADLVSENSRQLELLASAVELPTGSYDVVLANPNDIADYFASALAPLDMQGHYYKLPVAKDVGAPIGGKGLTMHINSPIPHCMVSATDANGEPLRETMVVERGEAKALMGNAMFAQYLARASTADLRSLRVEPGDRKRAELVSPRDGRPVLEIFSFSSFQASGGSQAFSGEIRLAVLHENGRSFPVRGGSVSGSIGASLADVELALETITTQCDGGFSFSGPCCIKIPQVSYSGLTR